ncbi:hypothetical protein [Aurantiacibacter luteus]|uniref:hypothetical protein n=1 Tax=Aurantiacibacter luteus TaxID=1581420 RepID=UPI000A77855E|nr:hypothetical protein [Aurantiacibacter luteus]
MIDIFSILLTHGLILLACWRMLPRADLDDETAGVAPAPARPWLKEGGESADA